MMTTVVRSCWIRPLPATGRPRIHVGAWLNPRPSRPKYYDYLSRLDIERKQIAEWKHLTRADEDPGKQDVMTWKTILCFLPGFIYFYVIPAFLRYLVYRLQKYVRIQFLYPLQRKMALWDAKFDALLCHLANKDRKFSLGMSLLRLQGKIGPSRELKYRIGLLRGKPLDYWKKIISQEEEEEKERQKEFEMIA